MDNNIYRQAEIELFNLFTRPPRSVSTSISKPEISNKETDISYSGPISKNSEIKDLNKKLKPLKTKLEN